jgi:hypothetical protein
VRAIGPSFSAPLRAEKGGDMSFLVIGRKERKKKKGDVIQKISRSKSTPYLNGANGMAFDTDAFALLTDFVKVGRAVETAEDAWMANIFMSKVCFL